jgi:hypothetical protein
MIWLMMMLVFVALVLLASVLAGAPYVPSHRHDVEFSLTKLYKVSPHDVLIDAGSGDGVVLRAAAELGARAIGYEINPLLIIASKLLTIRRALISVRWANFLQVDIPKEATVVYIFCVRAHLPKYQRHIQRNVDKHNRRLAVISYGFALPGSYPIKSLEPYSLYEFKPLHKNKA